MSRRLFLKCLSAALLPVAGGVTGCAVGRPSYDFSEVDSLLSGAVQRGEIPGVVTVIGQNDLILHRAVMGHRALIPAPEPMSWDTRFDMASLTKATITAPAIMQFWEQGAFQLDDPVARYLPDFAQNGKAAITIRHLLTHYSGLAPDLDLSTSWTGKDEAIRRAMAAVPQAPTGQHFVYSDINFIVLGLLVEQFSRLPLDVYATRHILQPIGMRESGFLPAETLKPLIAPTQYDEHHVPLRGVVHDPTARRMSGVAGHAGLFSDAQDMVLYASSLLDRLTGRVSNYPLRTETLRLMTSPQSPGETDQRGLGWDIATHYSTPRGDVFPVGSFGHTGYTGTSLWMDAASAAFVLILTNRVHPLDANGKAIVKLRHDVATVAARALRGGA
ncbi:serine hydrolase domain-containing protein [Acetobacter sp.]|jgi:CubicO group peptidase (beta-lactamase class C family)|uniref:serine hydrolase domain-containing protein n=1 Tax=Acetobacter sp. TaxID=440 RepID=UPI0025C611C1|nr:serine hydrolase domain-containing protein [Acetobacter sp.]MCH4091107.1 beta-lactamase family protein [Acetobacter sp.]MCI1300290.1 beta-lactamase family protein [Acetobacter sp.]MCI1316042.1 beta-lactamase family protein [Acetobacter sp.]